MVDARCPAEKQTTVKDARIVGDRAVGDIQRSATDDKATDTATATVIRRVVGNGRVNDSHIATRVKEATTIASCSVVREGAVAEGERAIIENPTTITSEA